jgi:hypothetical protein
MLGWVFHIFAKKLEKIPNNTLKGSFPPFQFNGPAEHLSCPLSFIHSPTSFELIFDEFQRLSRPPMEGRFCAFWTIPPLHVPHLLFSSHFRVLGIGSFLPTKLKSPKVNPPSPLPQIFPRIFAIFSLFSLRKLFQGRLIFDIPSGDNCLGLGKGWIGQMFGKGLLAVAQIGVGKVGNVQWRRKGINETNTQMDGIPWKLALALNYNRFWPPIFTV